MRGQQLARHGRADVESVKLTQIDETKGTARVDLAFLSLLGNDIGDEAAKAFARAVNTDDDRTDVALADRHIVRKRVRLFASDDPAKDVEA